VKNNTIPIDLTIQECHNLANIVAGCSGVFVLSFFQGGFMKGHISRYVGFISMILILLLVQFVFGGHTSLTRASVTADVTTRVSVTSDGEQGNGYSGISAISGSGRYVVFSSEATNLVSGDTNTFRDIFVHDRQSGDTIRVSVDSAGVQANDYSSYPAISADGRTVVFQSYASNLVSGDTNASADIFVYDEQDGETTRVSVNSDGEQASASSMFPDISPSGRYVVFMSSASNLVEGDTNSTFDVFVHDRQTGETSRVSVASDGTQGNGMSYQPAISGDGQIVAFVSAATNLVSGDTNSRDDVFVHDRTTGETTRVSVDSDGLQVNHASSAPALSSDGNFVAFYSESPLLVSGDANNTDDVFVHDLQTGETTLVSVASDGTQGNDESYSPAISADGNMVVFVSAASNLDAGDENEETDVFVHNRTTGETVCVSLSSEGVRGNADSGSPSVSADGTQFAFDSNASNLVSGDSNAAGDVFVRSPESVTEPTATPTEVSTEEPTPEPEQTPMLFLPALMKP
jgi:Tol biopolymer transport system component